MNELQVKGTQSFMGKEIPVVEGGFGKGQKVILAKTIAEIHGMRIGKINELINTNIDEFEFGVDILDLKTKPYQGSVLENNLFTKAQWGTNKEWFKVIVREREGHAFTQLKFTPTGVIEIAKILNVELNEDDLVDQNK